jgi:chloramphenicol-sensitive protein RarD
MMSRRGLWLAAGAYIVWGVFPIYWHMLANVPALQLVGNRIVWSFVLMAGYLLVTRQWRAMRVLAADRHVLRIYALAGILIAVNWLTYVWAITAGFIVESSLGYFINPLLNVVLGMIFFHERLRRGQWVAVAIATLGVLYLTIAYGSLPWIALVLAFSFGFYGVVKKRAPLNAAYGLSMETGILFLPALIYLVFCARTGTGAVFQSDPRTTLMLVGSGVVTAVPLLMFAGAVKRIPLSVVGIMQYIAPTLQFLIGVIVYQEPFTRTTAIGFSIVWVAVIIFAADGLRAGRVGVAGELAVEGFD